MGDRRRSTFHRKRPHGEPPSDDGATLTGARRVGSGCVAGVATAVAFAALHHALISDIWFSLIPMMLAGAACGGCLAWTYGVFFPDASRRTWMSYIGAQAALLFALGGASLAVFDPVVPMAVVVAADEPPRALIGQAIPLTVAFTLIGAVATSLLWGPTARGFGAALLSAAVLIVLLGLNVSVLGLVEMSGDSLFQVGEFFALLLVIMTAYGAVFYLLERRASFRVAGSPTAGSPGGATGRDASSGSAPRVG